MDKKDVFLIFALFAAALILIAFPWRSAITSAGTMEGENLSGNNAGGNSGPASAWANVPVQRFLLAPPLGGYMSARTDMASAPDAAPMYGCGGC